MLKKPGRPKEMFPCMPDTLAFFKRFATNEMRLTFDNLYYEDRLASFQYVIAMIPFIEDLYDIDFDKFQDWYNFHYSIISYNSLLLMIKRC